MTRLRPLHPPAAPAAPADAPSAARPVPRPRAAPELPRRPAVEPAPGPAPEPVGADLAVWELVRRAQDGDAEGFGLLYDRYVDVVFRFLLHRLGDRPTAEDFTSETFVRALRRIDSLSFQGRDVGAWLVTIA